MEMKKAIQTLFTLIMVAGMLAGCDGTTPEVTSIQSTRSTGENVAEATRTSTPANDPEFQTPTAETNSVEAERTPSEAGDAPNTAIPSQEAIARPTLGPDDWMSLPIVPTVSENARQIYLRGQALGRDPHAFSKIGDCQSITTFFLAYFDSPGLYRLGDYASLQESIDWFSGSFGRRSLAVKGGFNAAAILSPFRADPKVCNPDENPVACEIRVNNPSMVLISLEEWWAGQPEKYEAYMRQIIEYTIEQGVVPIVATKADNLEGNHLINQTIARLAWEYDIPLWNFWLAVQPLPDHGLRETTPDGKPDMFHLTHSENNYAFDTPPSRHSGWLMRNLTALQVIDAVWRGLDTLQPLPGGEGEG
jgi:hypothetical protein